VVDDKMVVKLVNHYGEVVHKATLVEKRGFYEEEIEEEVVEVTSVL